MFRAIKKNWPYLVTTFGLVVWLVSWGFGVEKRVEANTTNLFVQKSIIELMQVDTRTIPIIRTRVDIIDKKVDRLDDKMDMLLTRGEE